MELASSFGCGSLATDSNPAPAARPAENIVDEPTAAPLLITQVLDDVVVLPEVTDALVEGRCAADQTLEYWTFAGQDHGSIVQPGSPMDARWRLGGAFGRRAPRRAAASF